MFHCSRQSKGMSEVWDGLENISDKSHTLKLILKKHKRRLEESPIVDEPDRDDETDSSPETESDAVLNFGQMIQRGKRARKREERLDSTVY